MKLRAIYMAREGRCVRSTYIVLFSCLALLCGPASSGFAAESPKASSDRTTAGLAQRDERLGADSYLVGPGDLLEVRVSGDESISRAFSGQFYVEADGSVNYPVVGNLRVQGSSISQVAELIKDVLGDVAPISGMPFVRVAEYAPVFAVGDVAQAGPFPFRPGITVMQLVLRAGGLANVGDAGNRISELKREIADLEVVVYSLTVQRSRLLAELENQQFSGDLSDDQPQIAEGILQNEIALFGARGRERLSQVKSYEAQQHTYTQEIASLERTITLHDEELELLKERYAAQQSLAEQGLAPKSQVLEAGREILSMGRQGLEFRTALLRANQGRLAIVQLLDDVKIGTEVRNRQALSEVELELARNRTRLAGAKGALVDLELLERPRSMLSPRVSYTVLHMNGEQYEATRVDASSLLQRGNILLVEFGPDEPMPKIPAVDIVGAEQP